MHTNPRRLSLALALLAASLTAVPAADAGTSKRCRALAPKKARVVVKGPDSIVFVRGRRSQFTQTFFGCLYAKPRLYKIPGQNGGDTERFGRFTLNGRYVAYEHVNVEEASNFYPGFIEVADLRLRRRVSMHDAFPLTSEEQDTGAVTGLTQILLRADGAVAWIGREENSRRFSVQTALRTQSDPVEVDAGTDVGPRSLRRVIDDPDAFSWVRGGVRKTAKYGGG